MSARDGGSCPLSNTPLAQPCRGENCSKCGWNPEVERERKRQLRAFAAHHVLHLWGRDLTTNGPEDAERKLEELHEFSRRLKRAGKSIKGGRQ